MATTGTDTFEPAGALARAPYTYETLHAQRAGVAMSGAPPCWPRHPQAQDLKTRADGHYFKFVVCVCSVLARTRTARTREEATL